MKKRIVKFRNLPNSRLPAIIPPRSVVILASVDPLETPDWLGDRGRIFRIGFYSSQDGPDCIWLVNAKGEYEQTVNRDALLDHFIVLKLSDETDLFGTHSRPLKPVARVDRPTEMLASFT